VAGCHEISEKSSKIVPLGAPFFLRAPQHSAIVGTSQSGLLRRYIVAGKKERWKFAPKSRAFYIIIIKRLLKNVLLSVNYSQTLSLIPLQESKVSTRDISATKSIFLIVLQFIMLNSSAVFTGNR
jgi:hypothetical protein